MQPVPVYTVDRVSNTFMYACKSQYPSRAIQGLLYAYNIAILAFAGYLAYLTRSVGDSFNESVFIMLSVVAMSLTAVTILPIINSSDVSLQTIIVLSIAIWIVTTFTLLMMFGTKALALFIHYRDQRLNFGTRDFAHSTNSINSIASARAKSKGSLNSTDELAKGSAGSIANIYNTVKYASFALVSSMPGFNERPLSALIFYCTFLDFDDLLQGYNTFWLDRLERGHRFD
jgi:membrane-associated HD superfamily phosphohydrolase